MLHGNSSERTTGPFRQQVKAILKEARQHSTRDWCLLLLTFRHALRSQEARTLKLADIDLEHSTIAIARVKGSRSGVQSLTGIGESQFSTRLSRCAPGSATGGGRLPILFPSKGRSHDPDAVS